MQEEKSVPKPFRCDSAQWFLTYPQCPIEPTVLLQSLQAKKPIKDYIVAQENHATEGKHLHVYLNLVSKFNCRDKSFWDVIGFHPNIQSCKSPLAVQRYCIKDGNYITNIPVKEKLQAAESKKSLSGKLLLSGTPILEIINTYPEYAHDARKLAAEQKFIESLRAPVLPRCTGFIPNSFGIIMPLLPKSEKKRHYWYWSASPDKGKTTWLKSIYSQFPSFFYNSHEKFQNPSSQAQFVLHDEYSWAKLPVTTLNEMCDGTYQYSVEQGFSYFLEDPIILVCGNKSPMDIYSPEYHDLIKARFVINCLDI